jgi:hypothetical protein
MPTTITDILFSFDLEPDAIVKLSKEAKINAIGCGKEIVLKKLPRESWQLLGDISEKLWTSDLGNKEKINLGFELYELFPSYFHFLRPYYEAICNNEITDPQEKHLIWARLMKYLGEGEEYADPAAYVLWIEFFENENIVAEVWQGLLDHTSGKRSIMRLLECSGPVPFELKDILYNDLLADPVFHPAILFSLLYSAYDVYGQIDNRKAARVLSQLKINNESRPYKLLREKLK